VSEDQDTPSPGFPPDFDQVFSVGAEPGNSGFTGLNVLRGLVEGIDDFIAERKPRWRRFRAGPAMLACAPWVDDEELLARIGSMATCVVMVKRPRTKRELEKQARLREVNESAAGIRQDALPALGGMAPKVGAEPNRGRLGCLPLDQRPQREGDISGAVARFEPGPGSRRRP
jgi:hypothetical protein